MFNGLNSPRKFVLFFILVITLLFAVSVSSQNIDDGKRKEMHAIRANPGAVKLDGKLDDAVWQKARFVSDFLQKEPVQGDEPTEKTEVAIVYDDAAIYVGARMYSANPDKLDMYLDRRDNQGPTEQFIVTFDTYLDRRTAYGFGVNTSGVRFDRYNPEDNEFNRDFSFNPVWEARTSRDDVSWTVEMRIPFSQLRFIDKEKQVWGVNFNRWVPDRNEDIFWIYVPRNETGWSSRFGNLYGIEGVQPSRRIELLPYLASDGKFDDNRVAGDPFNDGSNIGARVGGDIKMGLGPNLTLDATFNPDFGQVEADAAEVNLSQFETFFSEKRPFFIEGSQLFDPFGPAYFYSRRIGASPHVRASGDFVGSPTNTTILGAAKLTGRLGSGTSLGILSAITGKEHARVYDSASGNETSVPIEPPTFFNVVSAQQEFGQDASTVGFVLTSVIRNLGDNSQFTDIMNNKAFSGGANWNLRFDGGKYAIRGYTGFSHVRGSSKKITSLQQTSAHYFQRPDAGHVELDTTRTSLSGYTTSLRAEKRSGKHWLGEIGFAAESPGFELNDGGILGSADDIDGWTWLQYRNTEPGKIFRNWNVNFNTNSGWNFGGVRQYQTFNVNANVTWNNFMSSWFGMNRQTRGQSDSRTRGGPIMSVESGYSWNGGLQSSFSGSTTWWVGGNYGIDELDGWLWNVNGNVSTRLGTRWKVSLSPRYTREDQPRQYVTAISGTNGGKKTFDTRYVFSKIARTTISTQIRANYFISPDISIELYAEPFVASGRFYDHGELRRPFTHDLLVYGEDDGTTKTQTGSESDYSIIDGSDSFTVPNNNFSSLSFRSNLVFRWEFTPGSTVFLVWQRSLSNGLESRSQRVNIGNLFDTVEGSGQDFVALKFSYWVPLK